MTIEIKHMGEKLGDVSEKVDALEDRPAKRWDALIGAVLGALAGGLGTVLVSLLTGG